MTYQTSAEQITAGGYRDLDASIGRIVSVTGSKAIVMLDNAKLMHTTSTSDRPEMGTLLGIDTNNTTVLGLVSALSVPVPAQREGDPEIWIAELSLVGELPRETDGRPGKFTRGVSIYPALGDLVRLANKEELAKSFSAQGENAIEVGHIRQDASIPATIKTDDMLGKHFAILGTTGTGKSCTTALILRAILDKNPAAHIVLLDPHNEYATSFGELAEVITPHNMTLPYWLLTFEEMLEVVLGDLDGRKQEIELLQELIPLCKDRYSEKASNGKAGLKRSLSSRFTIDTPVPYRLSDLTAVLDERMGMLENKKDLSPYRNLKTRIETITKDKRYAFMFGGLTVNDSMVDVLSRVFRVPVNGKPITILELTGLPTEIVNVVVSVLSRMTFDFALWGEGRIPVTIVCEEAHRYVPVNSALGFEPAKRALAKIAKEGRKYGASLCIVTQRPAEIDPTILSQCNTVFALRMSNDRDQEIVQAAISDTGSGLLEFLPALGAREAIAFGDGVTLPVRIKFNVLPKQFLPRSSTAAFSEKWQESTEDESLLSLVVERWRSSGHVVDPDAADEDEVAQPEAAPAPQQRLAQRAAPAPSRMAPPGGHPGGLAQRAAPGEAPRPAGGLLRRTAGEAPAAPMRPAQAPAAQPPSGAPERPRGAVSDDIRARLRQRNTGLTRNS